MAARAGVAGLLILAAAGCGGTVRPTAHARVLDCLSSHGWTTASQRDARDGSELAIVAARDGHATVELAFWGSPGEARRSVPGLAPIGVGWRRNVSFRGGTGFTYADEQTVDRCLGG